LDACAHPVPEAIAAAIVLTVHGGPHIEELPAIGLPAFAAGLGLWWAWLAVRSRKNESSGERSD
jgi:hypothetical protein